MLSTFRELIVDDVPPTQADFINTFKDRNPELKLRGIVSRLKRAYLSYVREYHLGYLLKKHFRKVIYDEKVDLSGVDYVIYYRGIKFNIHAYVNTENGKYWREVKNGRHKFYGEHLDIPMDLDRGKRCGKFILYTNDHVITLKNEMKRIADNKHRKNQSVT